jgi:hypothetical protein
MRKNTAVIDEAPAPPIRPEMLGKLKQEDMKQAIVEHFKVAVEAPRAGRQRKRSRYWQAADEEC